MTAASPDGRTGRVVGVDLGGTKIAAAAVDDDWTVAARQRVTTPTRGPQAVVDAIVAAVEDLRGDCGVAAVGVGAPGPVHDGTVVTAPNLSGWDAAVPLAGLLRQRLGQPVAVGNDANVGTLGECVAGAGRGSRFVLGVWLGTGVGGGIVLDGRLLEGAHGGAGELGHIVVKMGGRRCGCGRRGCLEAYAGRARLERAVEKAARKGRRTDLLGWRDEKGRGQITSGTWAKGLEQQDPVAVRLIDRAVAALGAGVGSVLNLLDVDRVVFGGGLTEKLGQPFVDRIAQATRPHLLAPDAPRTFVVAALGDDAGTVGAAALARDLLRPAGAGTSGAGAG